MNVSAHGKHILIVDDDALLLQSLEQRLKSWGFRVSTASTGETAMSRIESDLPQLILLDIMLPKMKGRELCAKLKQDSRTESIPIIFLTALSLPDHIHAGMGLGAEDYLVKPFDPEQLKERIELCLMRHVSPAEGTEDSHA